MNKKKTKQTNSAELVDIPAALNERQQKYKCKARGNSVFIHSARGYSAFSLSSTWVSVEGGT